MTYGTTRCPKHPTLWQPCQLCGTDRADLADDTEIEGVNWQEQGDIQYNTPKPPPVPHTSGWKKFAETHGVDEQEKDKKNRPLG